MAYSIENRLPGRVYAHASPLSRGGVSLFDAGTITTENAEQFVSDDSVVQRAKQELTRAGFTVLGTTDDSSTVSINIVGPPDAYEDYFDTILVTEEREVIQPGAVNLRRTRTYIDTARADLPGLISTEGLPAAQFLEGVALEQPATTLRGAGPLPKLDYWHLTTDQVAEYLGARTVHGRHILGTGVRLTMVDTGWEEHPYFVERSLKGTVVLGPGTSDREIDEDGHGTSESANAFALAPGIDFTMVKALDTNLLGAFIEAAQQKPQPQIINMSLEYDRKADLSALDPFLAAAVSLAVKKGIVVVCAAGNGHYAFPAQHPDTIAVGGVYRDEFEQLEASNYASAFTSAFYRDRKVPDVCGLVGMRPDATYILLPTPRGSTIDQEQSRKASDGTTPGDGWALLSGTSAAAPQVAGVCALLLERNPDLSPREVRSLLKATARPVDRGWSNEDTGGRSARAGATGAGLVSVERAMTLLMDR
ncbi:S8 family serine peptidase [Streptomyces sp. BH-SS-21]|uniref:S8 family serine peptidase n=1 Tax=Streptomyces liliiviolaceus TaxID=2823109 RepID=A0A941BBR9_9ACTN|nr:S8 family serine peptidase [Streptomyces liliiviolaceus]MBQ0855266.1 S8 family serine peptidase [Streptomyces liliiviolaceus]